MVPRYYPEIESKAFIDFYFFIVYMLLNSRYQVTRYVLVEYFGSALAHHIYLVVYRAKNVILGNQQTLDDNLTL